MRILPRYHCQVGGYSSELAMGEPANRLPSVRKDTALDAQGFTNLNKLMRLKPVTVMPEHRVL